MPLYFPRNKEEEEFALNELPDDIGEMKFSVCFVCAVVWTEVMLSLKETFQSTCKLVLVVFIGEIFNQTICYLGHCLIYCNLSHYD